MWGAVLGEEGLSPKSLSTLEAQMPWDPKCPQREPQRPGAVQSLARDPLGPDPPGGKRHLLSDFLAYTLSPVSSVLANLFPAWWHQKSLGYGFEFCLTFIAV